MSTVNGTPPSASKQLDMDVAKGLFYGFDVDDDSRDFLESLVASGTAPQDDVQKLYGISLMAGCEDWNMTVQCATSLRDSVLDGKFGTQLTPYLGIVRWGRDEKGLQWLVDIGAVPRLSPRGKAHEDASAERKKVTAKRGRSTAKSPFWTSPTGQSRTRRSTRLAAAARLEAARHVASNGFHSPAAVDKTSPDHKERSCTDEPEGSEGVDAPAASRLRSSGRRRRERGGEDAQTQLISPVTPPKRRQFDRPTAGHYNPPIHPRETASTEGAHPADEEFFSVNQETSETPTKQKRTRRPETSHYFDTPNPSKKQQDQDAQTSTLINPITSPYKKKPGRLPRGTVSALPIPPLSTDRFGLVQEELAHDPFRLLIAITFLIRTPGRVAIPVFRELMARYPTPQCLVEADPGAIILLIHDLGLFMRRCETIQKYARAWIECPPSKNVRYGVKNYPRPGDGKDVRSGERFGPEESDNDCNSPAGEASILDADSEAKTKARGFGTSWEIGHLTQGNYAIDSWRIFCRDVLLGRAEDWKGKGRGAEFQPEWMRVLPEDKELRACLRWMWMKEGWEWDPVTGEREALREELRRAVNEGRVAYDNSGQLQILDETCDVLNESRN